MILAVYVVDILLIGRYTMGIAETKIFLGDFAYQKNKLVLSQRKYALDLLQEAALFGKTLCYERYGATKILLGDGICLLEEQIGTITEKICI